MGVVRHGRRTVAGLLAMALLTTACAADGSSIAAGVSAERSEAASPSESRHETEPLFEPSELAGSEGRSAEQTEPSQGPSDDTGGPRRPPPSESSTREPFNPYASDVPVTASLTPTCTVGGGQFTIVIETRPEVVVAYHAIYAGEEGGAAEPYGKGHGGNNAGYSDEEGRYVDTWTVSPSAPIGEGRVEVFAGDEGKVGYIPVVFEITDLPAGGCT